MILTEKLSAEILMRSDSKKALFWRNKTEPVRKDMSLARQMNHV